MTVLATRSVPMIAADRGGGRAKRARLGGARATTALGACLFAFVANAQVLPGGLIGNRSGLRDPFASDFGEGDPLARGFSLKPYIDDAQRANISNGGDVRLFNELSGGLSSSINRDRAEGTLLARLTFRQPETGQGKSRLLLNELGKGSLDLVRNRVFLDVSTYADVITRDSAQGVAIDPQNTNGNLTQVYYVALQPRVQREIGDVAILTARYQASYTAIDGRIGGGTSGGGGGVPGSRGGGSGGGGQYAENNLFLRPLSNTVGQTGEVTLSNQPRDGRFFVKLTGRVVDQSQERLRQDFRNYVGNVDVTYALTRVTALVGLVGYEDYKNSERAIQLTREYLRFPVLTTAAAGGTGEFTSALYPNGLNFSAGAVSQDGLQTALPGFVQNPVYQTQFLTNPALALTRFPNGNIGPILLGLGQQLDPVTGEYVPDPSGRRNTTYSQHGVVYNVGFRYTPSRRSLFELRVGQRFADVTVTGSVRQEFRGGLILTGSLADGIETSSAILTRVIDGVPTSFVGGAGRGASVGGCVSGVAKGGTSDCLGNQNETLSEGVFRSRYGRLGADLNRGRTNYSIEYTYINRRYLDAGATVGPASPIDPTLSKREDITQRVFARAEHRFTNRQSGTIGVFYGNYDLGLTRKTSDNYVGADARYNFRVNRNIDLFASGSATQRFSGRIGNTLFSSIAAGARYNF